MGEKYNPNDPEIIATHADALKINEAMTTAAELRKRAEEIEREALETTTEHDEHERQAHKRYVGLMKSQGIKSKNIHALSDLKQRIYKYKDQTSWEKWQEIERLRISIGSMVRFKDPKKYLLPSNYYQKVTRITPGCQIQLGRAHSYSPYEFET